MLPYQIIVLEIWKQAEVVKKIVGKFNADLLNDDGCVKIIKERMRKIYRDETIGTYRSRWEFLQLGG